MQIDNPARGFTFKQQGPLDMRMDATNSSIETAAEYIKRASHSDLSSILEENSDEEFSSEIASAIIQRRSGGKLSTTIELADAIREGCQLAHENRKLNPPTKEVINGAIARTMQALRIQVNSEFRALETLLDSLPHILKSGGRVVFLTFHSGEDRRVKKALKTYFNRGIFSSWSRDVVRAGAVERRANPRSKCAKLRWAVRA